MRGVRIAVCALGLGVALLGGVADSARAGKGGVPAAHSCGLGRAEAAFLRALPVRPGAAHLSAGGVPAGYTAGGPEPAPRAVAAHGVYRRDLRRTNRAGRGHPARRRAPPRGGPAARC